MSGQVSRKSGPEIRPEIRDVEVATGFEPVNQGFAIPCLTTWLRHQKGFVRESSQDPIETPETTIPTTIQTTILSENLPSNDDAWMFLGAPCLQRSPRVPEKTSGKERGEEP